MYSISVESQLAAGTPHPEDVETERLAAPEHGRQVRAGGGVDAQGAHFKAGLVVW